MLNRSNRYTACIAVEVSNMDLFTLEKLIERDRDR